MENEHAYQDTFKKTILALCVHLQDVCSVKAKTFVQNVNRASCTIRTKINVNAQMVKSSKMMSVNLNLRYFWLS